VPAKDMFGKRTFKDETPRLTGGSLVFEIPAKLPIASFEADGFLKLVPEFPLSHLRRLPYPWPLFSGEETVLELKMQGDHLDKKALKRALLQRQIREFHRYDKEKPAFLGEEPLWIVAAILPDWLRSYYEKAEQVAPGCYRLSAQLFELYWIASNELELLPELIPFLVTRDGKPLEEFARWVVGKRPPPFVYTLLSVLSLEKAVRDEILEKLPDTKDPELIAQRRAVMEDIARRDPEARRALAQELLQETLLSMVALKLGRKLTAAEREVAQKKLARGKKAFEKALLEKDKAELQTWLFGAPQKKPSAKKASSKSKPKSTRKH
jgi:hypothetical protein